MEHMVKIAKTFFIFAMVSLLLMLVTFYLNPIFISEIDWIPGVHVLIFFALFIFSLLISILAITIASIKNKSKNKLK